ncbi:hypothetical protein C7C46_09055 [Streptomyces tateyamensis]|uniref:Uncharacterized protein n=1 Tax=Streptomyces tateyamensis TaxID=565073 RepID=A0A2V4PHM6_9ACTN|nr:hypothetical protein C7C46_09055 [Streptomyces tateyamensis]
MRRGAAVSAPASLMTIRVYSVGEDGRRHPRGEQRIVLQDGTSQHVRPLTGEWPPCACSRCQPAQ